MAAGSFKIYGLQKDGVRIPVAGSTTGGEFDFLNYVYPIGSIYMSVNSTSPATLFGGTWEQIKDTFLLASGNVYSAGSTGGGAAHNNMPPYLAVNVWKRIE